MKLNVPTSKTGAVGDVVYVRSRQGTSVRARVINPDPKTSHQLSVRARLATVVCGWRRITNAQREQWKSYATGIPGNLSGCNAYVQVNSIRVLCGDPTFESPPPIPVSGHLTLTAFNAVHAFAAPHAFTMSLLATNTVAPDGYIIEATPPRSPGISNHGTKYRVILTAANLADLATLETAYMARFGNPPDGEAIALRVTPVINGCKDGTLAISTIVRRLTE